MSACIAAFIPPYGLNQCSVQCVNLNCYFTGAREIVTDNSGFFIIRIDNIVQNSNAAALIVYALNIKPERADKRVPVIRNYIRRSVKTRDKHIGRR